MRTKVTDGLDLAVQGEIAFAVQEFNKLPGTERKMILYGLQSENLQIRTVATRRFVPLLLNGNNAVLTEFINQFIGQPGLFDSYEINNMPEKCSLVGRYILENLPPADGTLVQELTTPLEAGVGG